MTEFAEKYKILNLENNSLILDNGNEYNQSSVAFLLMFFLYCYFFYSIIVLLIIEKFLNYDTIGIIIRVLAYVIPIPLLFGYPLGHHKNFQRKLRAKWRKVYLTKNGITIIGDKNTDEISIESNSLTELLIGYFGKLNLIVGRNEKMLNFYLKLTLKTHNDQYNLGVIFMSSNREKLNQYQVELEDFLLKHYHIKPIKTSRFSAFFAEFSL